MSYCLVCKIVSVMYRHFFTTTTYAYTQDAYTHTQLKNKKKREKAHKFVCLSRIVACLSANRKKIYHDDYDSSREKAFSGENLLLFCFFHYHFPFVYPHDTLLL